MKTETVAEFLARGGSVEKSTEELNLAELLEKESMLSQGDAESITKDLSETLKSSLDKLGAQ